LNVKIMFGFPCFRNQRVLRSTFLEYIFDRNFRVVGI
jgi:uncharacterized protein (DUF433 family)